MASPQRPSARRVLKAIRTKTTRSFRRRLLRWGAAVAALRWSAGENALHVTCREGRLDLLAPLLEAGVSAADRDASGCTALHYAVRWCPTGGAQEFRRKYLEPLRASCDEEDLFLAEDSHGMTCMDYLRELEEEGARTDAAIASAENEAEEKLEGLSASSYFDRLKEECAADLFDQGFSSRYNEANDVLLERSSRAESFDDWCERIAREFANRQSALHPPAVPAKRRRPPSPPPLPPAALLPPPLAPLTAADLRAALQRSDTLWQEVAASDTRDLRYRDLPWPKFLPDLAETGGALLGPEERRKALKELQVRWHPDRFNQKLGDRLHPDERERIVRKVLEVSQICNGLLCD